ncbi:MAG: PAS domain S-box protein [Bacteroidetes bacterium]|nr:PAS domain S-box protein [Bacteroidota bacterium]
MNDKLSVLIIEDSQDDAELNAWYLKKAGYNIDFTRVETPGEMKNAVASQKWDMILSDYSMPMFDVLSALAIYHASGLDIPFIVISGAIGEEKAVEMIKAGAHDYLLKDNMMRFAPVVKRELREAHLRQNLSDANIALSASEERYRTMIKASPDGIFILDINGVITEVTAAGLALFGTDAPADLVGKPFSEFVPAPEIRELAEIYEKTIREGLAQNIEIRLLKKDKSLLVTEASATLLHDPVGRPISFMIIIRDISQRKNLEMQLIHSDRMAGLGEMASGIAHEINQPLNTISMAMDNILGELATDEKIEKTYLQKKTDKIFENITRIRNIIDHIRVFSRGHDDYISTAFSINSSIRNAISMVSEQFKYHAINLNLLLDDGLPQVVGNTFKFEQVILNLLSNAKDALLEKESGQDTWVDKSIEIRSFAEKQQLIVEVSDNGAGIADENLQQVMLPFYTTKDPGKGTGLGLSVSYQIIKEMHGTIEFSSTVSVGTKIKIILNIQNAREE